MLQTLKALGIDPEKKVTVSDLLSNFREYWLKKNDVIKTKSYELEVNTAAQAADIMNAHEKIGISNIYITRLEHSNIKTIENEFRMRAVVDAQQGESAR